LWAGGALIGAVVAAVALASADASPVLVALPVLAWLVFVAVGVGMLPRLAYRRWRFGIDDEEIDLQRGRLWVERVLIPMARVQHVDTQTGPLSRRLGLASVFVHTAAGAFEIPALDRARAAELRVRIARLARVGDEL
jgi:membrane protein YdbS with pleckstrin-like domain